MGDQIRTPPYGVRLRDTAECFGVSKLCAFSSGEYDGKKIKMCSALFARLKKDEVLTSHYLFTHLQSKAHF